MFGIDERTTARFGAKGERPNMGAGLAAKRAEIAGKIKFHHAELRKLTCDLDHLDATLRIFAAEPDETRVAPYRIAHATMSPVLGRKPL